MDELTNHVLDLYYEALYLDPLDADALTNSAVLTVFCSGQGGDAQELLDVVCVGCQNATHTATHCNTHCNALQHTLQRTATHTAAHCNTHCNALQHTLQFTAGA